MIPPCPAGGSVSWPEPSSLAFGPDSAVTIRASVDRDEPEVAGAVPSALDDGRTQEVDRLEVPEDHTHDPSDWDRLTEFTRRLLAAPGVIGLDVTIYNPDLDPDGDGARRIVRYLADSLEGRLAASTR